MDVASTPDIFTAHDVAVDVINVKLTSGTMNHQKNLSF